MHLWPHHLHQPRRPFPVIQQFGSISHGFRASKLYTMQHCDNPCTRLSLETASQAINTCSHSITTFVDVLFCFLFFSLDLSYSSTASPLNGFSFFKWLLKDFLEASRTCHCEVILPGTSTESGSHCFCVHFSSTTSFWWLPHASKTSISWDPFQVNRSCPPAALFCSSSSS